MRLTLVADLEEFVRRGSLWDPAELEVLVDRLETASSTSGDPILALLARPLQSVLAHLRIGPVVPRTAADIEAIVYPRLWKVMEAVGEGLPDGELRTRIDVLNRRLAQRLARETPGGSGRDRARSGPGTEHPDGGQPRRPRDN